MSLLVIRGLIAAWALFVIGGAWAGWHGVRTLSDLHLHSASPQLVGAPRALADDAPQPARAPLRAADDPPPPFAAAAPAAAAPTPRPSSPAGRLTILLLGIDQRPDETGPGGDPGRTDSMLLVSIDYDAHTASMVSIPRDSFVVIPGYGSDRVNAAYTYGELQQRGTGAQLARRTVASVLDVPVDRFALVDVHSMERIIDTLGGVTIDVPSRLVDREYPTDDYGVMLVDIPAGRQRMDGVTAVQYARMRHPDSDYGRQGRQQQLLLALRDAALRVDTLPKLPLLIPEVQKMVRTDLTPMEIAQLVAFGRGISPSRDVVALAANPQLTPSYVGPGGAAYINLTPQFRAAVKALVEQPRIVAERAHIAIYNAGAPVGSGGRVADLLGRRGLTVSTIDRAPAVQATRVEAGSGARETATAVARVLGLNAEALVVEGDSTDVQVLLGPDTRLPSG